jgi:PhoH-like ATPase
MTELQQPAVRLNRIFVLDTNVLIHDPNAFFAFHGVVVCIPFMVLEELDALKREVGEKGHNARQSIRLLEEMRRKGHLGDGVPLEHDTKGSVLRVMRNPAQIDFDLVQRDLHEIKDNAILQTAANLTKDGNRVTLVTKDINVRIKADALGIDSEDYTKGIVSDEQFFKGWIRHAMPANFLRQATIKTIGSTIDNQALLPNQFVILESESNEENYRLFRHLSNGYFKEVEPMTLLHTFTAKNVQQLMTLDLLLDDSVQIVTLLGGAGTGKTFLTLLAGLYKTASERAYRKLMVTRPVVALGADIGFLPGDMQEKLHYWMQPVYDNLEFIGSKMLRGSEQMLGLGPKDARPNKKHDRPENHRERYRNSQNGHNNDRDHNRDRYRNNDKHDFQPSRPEQNQLVARLQQQGILSLEAITYMRGRSIPNQFVFIDEVQNLTPHEVKTIVSRAGEGTKVILAGDPYQIDSPYLDFNSNGLTVSTERLKGNALFGSVFLEKSERSALAQLAGDLL